MSKNNNISKEFEQKYEALKQEQEILKFWDINETYKFDNNSEKVVFSIDTPPPTMSGKMHIGHAFSYSQTDFIVRYKRMNGFEVFYPFGTDDNGLATEKLVQKEKGVDLRKLTREEAVKITMEYIKENRPQFVSDWKQLGISCDFENLGYSTISPEVQKVSQESFLKLVDKGLIERRKGPIPWDRVFQTTIAQAELEDKEVKSKMNYIKAKVVNSNHTYIIYATTRPEMIFACHGFSLEDSGDYVKLKVNNNGQEEFWIFGGATYEEKLNTFNIEFEVIETLKGQDLIGEKVVIPLINREIRITHDQSIKADLGTGAAYFCSFGGVEDIEYIKRHPDIEIHEIMNLDGTLNELCGDCEGLIASVEGRFAVMKKLKEDGSMVAQESIKQIVNVGERSGAVVEYIASEQWFVKYLDKKEMFFEFAQKFNWTPEFMKSRIDNWIKGLGWDWGFSRQRHFGIPIPVWINTKTNATIYPTKEMLPLDPTQTSIPKELCESGFSPEDYRGENDVLDTWFTSASTPIIAASLVNNNASDGDNKLFPMSLRPQGHDIINFWLFYTMAKNNLIYEQNPFEDVAISGWVLAPDGTKMSKSKGNTIAPQDIVDKYSNDALRFAAASSKLGQDAPFQEKEVKTGMGVTNKIYNSVKFASMLFDDFDVKDKNIDIKSLQSIDKWILAKCQTIIKNSNSGFDKYDYEKAKSVWTNFFMNDVCNDYIEIVKQRLWQKKDNYKAAQSTLYYVLVNSMKGLAPIMPFITEEVFQKFFSKFENENSIHKSLYPIVENKYEFNKQLSSGEEFVGIVKEIRRFKAQEQMSLKEIIPKYSKEVYSEYYDDIMNSIEDLKAVCGVSEFDITRKSISISLNMGNGTYGDNALDEMLSKNNIKFKKVVSNNIEHLKNLISKETYLGLIPFENSVTGTFREYFPLLNSEDIEIISEVKIETQNVLMSNKTAKIEDIKKVYSHNQILQQCQNFIVKHNFLTFGMKSSSYAAHYANKKDEIIGIIGPEKLAKEYNLNIIQRNIEGKKKSINTFLLVKKKNKHFEFESKLEHNSKISMLITVESQAGYLHNILAEFANLNINILKIENVKNENGIDLIYIEFNGDIWNEINQTLISNLESKEFRFKILGNF